MTAPSDSEILIALRGRLTPSLLNEVSVQLATSDWARRRNNNNGNQQQQRRLGQSEGGKVADMEEADLP